MIWFSALDIYFTLLWECQGRFLLQVGYLLGTDFYFLIDTVVKVYTTVQIVIYG